MTPRRRFLSVAAALLTGAIGIALGCDRDSNTASTSSTATTQSAGGGTGGSSSAGGSRELNLFGWSEYVPKAVLEGFTKETGITVNYEEYDSNEKMLAKLGQEKGKYDLIQPSEYTVEYLVKNGMVERIDTSKLSNLKNVAPEFLKQPHDPEQKYSIPYMSGFVVIVYNTDKVKEPVVSLKDVFQDKYKGKIIVLDDSREIVSWAMATLGLRSNDVSKENLEKIRPIVERWTKLIKVYDSDSPKDKLAGGEVDIGVTWNGEAAKLLQQDKKWKVVYPTEGTHQYVDNLAVPSGAPHKDAAMLFMNYVLRPEVSKLISDEFPYTNPNAGARKLLTPEQLANPASYPKDAPTERFRDIPQDLQSEIDKLVTEAKGE
jgi:spermidine/putrescine transport system permease protein